LAAKHDTNHKHLLTLGICGQPQDISLPHLLEGALKQDAPFHQNLRKLRNLVIHFSSHENFREEIRLLHEFLAVFKSTDSTDSVHKTLMLLGMDMEAHWGDAAAPESLLNLFGCECWQDSSIQCLVFYMPSRMKHERKKEGTWWKALSQKIEAEKLNHNAKVYVALPKPKPRQYSETKAAQVGTDCDNWYSLLSKKVGHSFVF